MKKPVSVLLFSIALNGYQWQYQRCLKSHKKYAKKWGYTYCLINKPWFTTLGVECCWLKLPVIQQALQSGYDYVVFVDADAFVADDAPNIISTLSEKHSLFMAKGYSGRFNSGVIVACRDERVVQWLDTVIAHRNKPIANENSVGWGENGHIIHFARNVPFISELDLRWNNTYHDALNDFVRHFNHGPLRNSRYKRLFHKLLSRCSRALNYWLSNNGPYCSLLVLTQKVLARYPQLQFKSHNDFSK